jgi:hypothetical protein
LEIKFLEEMKEIHQRLFEGMIVYKIICEEVIAFI